MCVADAAEAALPARCERAARRFFWGVAGRFAFLHVLPLFFFGLFRRMWRACALSLGIACSCAR